MRGTARFLVIVSGAAVAYGGFMPWLDDLKASELPLRNIVSGQLRGAGGWTSSLAVVLVIAAVLIVLGGLVDSRIAVFLGLLVGLAAAGGWLAQLVIHRPGLTATDFGNGYWITAAGLMLSLLSAAWPGGRRYAEATALYYGG
jgi:hypothetical protein